MGKYRAGQVWTYKTRPGEEASRLVVCQVDANQDGESQNGAGQNGESIVHVYLEGLTIHSSTSLAPAITTLSHLPMAETALDGSTIDCVGERSPLPEFEDSYQAWQVGYRRGLAPVFRDSIAESVAKVEEVIFAPITRMDFPPDLGIKGLP